MFDTKNAFEIFDFPVEYSIDLVDLEKKYFSLQKKWHPDRFVGHRVLEKQQAQDNGSRINEAYQILKDPIRRAELLLDLIFGLTNAPPANGDMLSNQFALSSAIEQEYSPDNLLVLKKNITAQIDQEEEQLKTHIKAKDIGAFQDYFFFKFLQKALITLNQKIDLLSH